MTEAQSQLYYIVDTAGNYYRLGTDNQLSPAMNEDEAGRFTFFEANSRIGSGKKSHFYSAIPIEQNNEEAEKETKVSRVDWTIYLRNFVSLASHTAAYKEELVQKQSVTDMKICDILHFIELYEADEDKALELVDMLRMYREERRDIKDELVKLDLFQKSIGTSVNITKAKDSIKQMEKLEKRKYTPRQLPEIFENSVIRSRETEERETRDSSAKTNAEAYEEKIIMEKHKTAFDDSKNDWFAFAMQQVQFYRDIRQYMTNLQIEIQEIDGQIEEMLNVIEGANANVAQGYKLFKMMKELRVQKKEKQDELSQLQMLTDYVDCDYMNDTYQYNLEQMEKKISSSKAEIVEIGEKLEIAAI